MKVTVSKIRSFIFILLFLLGISLVIPLHRAIVSSAENMVNSLSSKIYEKTGLTFSYEKLSPSILSTLTVKKIKFLDDDNNVVLSIKKTNIDYSLIKLLKHDFSNGFTSFVIDGIDLNLGEIMSMKDYIQKNNQGKTKNQKGSKNSSEIDFDTFYHLIPKNVRLKNVTLTYDKNGVNAGLRIRDFDFSPNSQKNGLNFEIESKIRLQIEKLSQKINMNAVFAGSILHKGDGSYVTARLSNISNGIYSIKKLNLLADYQNNTAGIHIIQNENPVSFGADYHLDTKDLNIQLKTKDFKPVQIFNSSTSRKTVKKLNDLILNTDTILKYSFSDKALDYVSDSNIHLPDSIFAGGADIDFSLYGDETHLELSKFSAAGQRILSNMNFDFIFDGYRLSGVFELPYFVFENGKSLSTELYIDPMEKGFEAFSPQLFVGDKSLSALQFKLIPLNDSIYYSFEASDFSHLDFGDAGLIKADGNILPSQKYAELNLNLQSVFADSLILFAAQAMKEDSAQTLESAAKSLSSVLLSGDVYLSTDLKSLSYNVPYIIAANIEKENQTVLLSFGGNEQSLQINKLSAVLGKMNFEVAGTLDRNKEERELFFNVDIASSSIPYHFSGNIRQDFISIAGDYNSQINLNFYPDSRISGSLACENLPLVYDQMTAVLSTRSNFTYTKDQGPEILVNLFEFEAAGANYTVSPKIMFRGSVTKYGAHLDNLGYSDIYSTLAGQADFAFDLNDGIFNALNVNAALNNSYSEESVNLVLNATNPMGQKFSKETILNEIYLDLQMQLVNLNLNHITVAKSENNFVTGSLFATGTFTHPYVTLNLAELSLASNGGVTKMSGALLLEERNLSVQTLNVKKGNSEFSDIQADFSLETMTGSASGNLYSSVIKKSIQSPFKIEVNNSTIPEGKFLPDSFMVTLSLPSIHGSFIKKQFGFTASMMYSEGNINFFTSDNVGLFGSLTSDHFLELNFDNNSFAKLKVFGTTGQKLDINITDVDFDLEKAFSYFNFDTLFIVNGGRLSGFAGITGPSSEPDIKGNLAIFEPQLIFSLISQQKLQAPYTPITIENSEIKIEETVFSIKKTEKILGKASIFLNRFSFDHMEASLKSIGDEKFPGKLKTKQFLIKSDVNIDLALFYENGVMEIGGKIIGENTSFTADVQKIAGLTSEPDPKGMNFRTDLDIQLGNHATFILDPVLRAVLVPKSHLTVSVDTYDQAYAVDGNVGVRTGDIAYLNRSFYIKGGRIKFNQEDLLNPLVSLRAETRERDDNGKTVTISMNVENQYLRELSPRFSASPAKSESEIRKLLGQIAIADSSDKNGMSGTNLLFAAGDYAIQSSVGRKIENSLREVLNFDIFSVRTNVLQNTLSYGVRRNSSSSKEVFTIGNLLDNSTVYMGKYLGSSLYFDTMLHLSLDETVQSYEELTASNSLNLNFQPEFGLELESPFVNIRWSVSPDIKALLNQQYKPSSALTLSWKFEF
ncbi:translocation/assembly module TamB domain-containing protein [Treponema sp. C6A8]|uniref:translocation/assembly module TamB domain-containing protein n=1 Tax=Treponema sp. C6A8 TaxID=1410609 RepID=UPI0004845A7E|nr:translocation/assembly module TamB domain-containing protein [Treponema sp. C6A8]